jgi:hypothetical protein
MSNKFTLGQLTEGIRDRNVGQDGGRLINKWTRTGLLRGLNEHKRENMARLLENQAAQVLREANTLGSGQGGSNVQGFTNIAFPIVRRVFGGLVANELVSIQPMSLPSGLLFYLDYTYGSDVGGDSAADGSTGSTNGETFTEGQSIYGSPNGRSIRTGANATGGQYDLAGTSYSLKHAREIKITGLQHFNGAFGTTDSQVAALGSNIGVSGADAKAVQFDPQILNRISNGDNEYQLLVLSASLLTDGSNNVDPTQMKSVGLYSQDANDFGAAQNIGEAVQAGTLKNVRRLNQLGRMSGAIGAGTFSFTPDPTVSVAALNAGLLTVIQLADGGTLADQNGGVTNLTASFVIGDTLSVTSTGDGVGQALTIPSFESDFASTPSPFIPEIDIKIESIAVTAQTRKLRARWSPELAQDLNAYHSLDAEVELTQILSEQIALEIDREILNDLLVEAQGANFFWSRAPGKFLNKRTGAAQNLASSLATGPQFTGTVREWYETLVETIIDVANEIHRKTLRGSANFIVVSPEVATIFEASVLYKPSIKIDGQGQVAAPFSLGAEAIGFFINRFIVYKDPYFPRNKILVGYKGGSYLEFGYVYVSYVPLIVTPTIFAPEDFTPRKGVMTRYGKKMVRADFYGTVTCLDMDVI